MMMNDEITLRFTLLNKDKHVQMYLYQQMFQLNLVVLFPLEDHMHQLRRYDALKMV